MSAMGGKRTFVGSASSWELTKNALGLALYYNTNTQLRRKKGTKMTSKRGRLFAASMLLSLGAGGCAGTAEAPLERAAVAPGRIGPAVDHHQHLLSAAGAALLQKFEGGGPLAPVALPGEVADLLKRRSDAWNDAAALAEIYAEDAILLENRPIAGRKEVAHHVSQRFGRAYSLVPLSYAEGEAAGASRPCTCAERARSAPMSAWR